MEAATEAIKNPTKTEVKSADCPPTKAFEEVAAEKHFAFPPYIAADIGALRRQYLPRDFKGMIKAILEIESPLSEELLLKRIVWCFGREKVTSVVKQAYEQQIYGYRSYGIIRKKGH